MSFDELSSGSKMTKNCVVETYNFFKLEIIFTKNFVGVCLKSILFNSQINGL